VLGPFTSSSTHRGSASVSAEAFPTVRRSRAGTGVASQTSSTTSAFGRHLSTQRVQKRLGPFPVSRRVGPKDVVVLEVPGRCSG
jgi:hypothetical protein